MTIFVPVHAALCRSRPLGAPKVDIGSQQSLVKEPVSLHTGEPVLHEIAPTWQVLPGLHAAFAVHALQLPPPQTMFVPQFVPSGRGLPVGVHTAEPVEQTIWPVV
jgi:hypothetical protein